MQAMIDELAKQAAESLGQVSSKETLASFWQEYLSKNGKIPALMKNLRTVAPEERPAMGKIINELKQKVQADYDAAAETVKHIEGAVIAAEREFRERLLAGVKRLSVHALGAERIQHPGAARNGNLAFARLPAHEDCNFPQILRRHHARSPSFLDSSVTFDATCPIDPAPSVITTSPSRTTFRIAAGTSSTRCS